ncbi:phage baseplate protein [Enterococcus quebecensis]|uniref:Baseplate structural protein Gp10 C-terminal domain-containing protein n=1 Tax=Enterococcus quebecensis TaxID=903983 RepID=A0A1E5GUN9_9ENTE|nr:hypothetical protein [Enterococcus quebecensis]OEG16379.1 hypothetical protein BCR23_05675 [Enterococcus quebecensis]OJG72750.1 antireceptor [Enterococcus quebecensis]
MDLEKIYRGMENGAEAIQENFSILAKALYPVGSVFQSVNDSDPSTLFGGTWERIKGKVLVGVDEGDSDFTAGKIGGKKEHIHGLSQGYAQLQISGSVLANNSIGEIPAYKGTTKAVDFKALANNEEFKLGTRLAGYTDLANNLQPYKTVYIWVRIA